VKPKEGVFVRLTFWSRLIMICGDNFVVDLDIRKKKKKKKKNKKEASL